MVKRVKKKLSEFLMKQEEREELARAARRQQQAPAAAAPAAGPRGPAFVDPLEAGGCLDKLYYVIFSIFIFTCTMV